MWSQYKEPLCNPGDWIVDHRLNVALWFTNINGIRPNANLTVITDGLVLASIGELVVGCAYISPNSSKEAFNKFLYDLHEATSDIGHRIIIMGDFNCKSSAWGARVLDERGAALCETLWACKLHPITTQGGFTFKKGSKMPKIDFACADRLTCEAITSSRVLGVESGSDHLYLFHCFRGAAKFVPGT
ncbi:uncharacterized protein LOC143187680 [Calliopsis andreniformis]|uniref:uncharacterized protein LOC143187680 n=1 Tax=Calliopsis andreniformis TaxID=337506 RepID=UPI003FCEE10F